jgi:hypothetical protein
MDGGSQHSHDPQRSSRPSAAGLLACVMISGALGTAVPMSGCAQAAPSGSPSYQEGYDGLMNTGRSFVAEATRRGVTGSLATFAGSPQQVATTCENYLEGKMAGNSLAIAAGNPPTLPTGFSSADFLRGCTDAGKAMLASG